MSIHLCFEQAKLASVGVEDTVCTLHATKTLRWWRRLFTRMTGKRSLCICVGDVGVSNDY